VTKKEIVDELRDQMEMTRKDAETVLESALEIIKEELEQGRSVMILGFGEWSVLTKRARKGRSPKTGEALTIKGRKVVTFKSSQTLKSPFQDL